VQTGISESGRTFLAKSEVTMPTFLVAEWPAEVDVEVRVPVAEPEMLKRIEMLPADPIELARGVQWFVDLAGGDGFRRKRSDDDLLNGPAFILQVDRAEADPLVDYTYDFRLKDKDFRMRTFGGSPTNRRPTSNKSSATTHRSISSSSTSSDTALSDTKKFVSGLI
jgi:hypothetical protein